MTLIHTDPALAARRRPLKPLLAQVLAGEPWIIALEDPDLTPAPVAAACIVSYISRRRSDWAELPAELLRGATEHNLACDRDRCRPGEWPFLDALEVLVPRAPWPRLDPLLEPYRRAME